MTALYPLRLAPSWREKIWGSTNLEPLFGPQDRQIGEVWFSFEQNTVTNGPWAGETLASLMARHGAALMGEAGLSNAAGPYFPILVKFLFTSDKLSVQVHPNDAYARKHEGGPGKTEMWYVLRADPGAAIAIGLTEALSGEELRRAALSGEIARFLNWVEVKQGDAIFVPAGTLHSIGPGLALCEIQQNSDLTYRFYDFGRLDEQGKPRPLHVDKAVDVTEVAPYDGLQQPVSFIREGMEGETLAVCDYFAVERLRWLSHLPYAPDPARMHLLVFLEGSGMLGSEPYRPGDVYLIPAAMERFEWRPAAPTVALRAYAPGE
ncbi:MAG: mannose-6-phosphate isomerase [Acidobacteria bacterium]|nr:mannose-6-phosphate isomerase [Acidobacteriota bacterium]